MLKGDKMSNAAFNIGYCFWNLSLIDTFFLPKLFFRQPLSTVKVTIHFGSSRTFPSQINLLSCYKNNKKKIFSIEKC